MLKAIRGVSRVSLVLVGMFFVSMALLISENVNADSNVDYNVNISPSLNLTLTGDNPINLNLNPNTKTSDSKSVTLSVSTNNITGYNLTMSTTGDDTNLNRNATLDSVNATIPTLSSGSYATPSAFPDNTWGYKQDSGDFIPYVSGREIKNTSTAIDNDTTTLAFGAKINYEQVSGVYSTTLNFTAVANPLFHYIQNLDPTLCTATPLTVVDKRDGNEYTVAKINNNCWMTQNLRYVGDTGSTSTSMIMKADTSNIASDQTLTIGDLTLGNDYNNARIHVATSGQVPSGASYTATDMGVWYNYAAASAGFVTSNQNSTAESTYSVCPAGWRLPTNSEQSGITSYTSQYSAVTGGRCGGGSVGSSTEYGFWWSSTPYHSNSSYRYYLYYNESSLDTSYSGRYYGFYVRCIRSTT